MQGQVLALPPRRRCNGNVSSHLCSSTCQPLGCHPSSPLATSGLLLCASSSSCAHTHTHLLTLECTLVYTGHSLLELLQVCTLADPHTSGGWSCAPAGGGMGRDLNLTCSFAVPIWSFLPRTGGRSHTQSHSFPSSCHKARLSSDTSPLGF